MDDVAMVIPFMPQAVEPKTVQAAEPQLVQAECHCRVVG